ncbi:MAG: ribosome biogenesis GTPase Der [Firmicutes bacterium]|nr:ribosome biogenesis GTPase Der [Bacillota bacterium]
MNNSREKSIVAVVGRPNTGKSTLFNRLAGKAVSIVADEPGVTRDRVYSVCSWRGKEFTIVDTGGMGYETVAELKDMVERQIRLAFEEADFIIFMVDAREGLNPLDQEAASLIRNSGKPCLLVANKVDNENRELNVAEFYSLGMGEPFPISALHGLNIGDLLDIVAEALPEMKEESGEELLSIAIIGRQNVGKSSLLNLLIEEERSIVAPHPGTTRDALDTVVKRDGKEYLFIDTAGLRRKGKVKEKIEYFSTIRALRAVDRSRVTLLMLEAHEGIVQQDKRIASEADKAGKASIIVVNKWDIVKEKLSGVKLQQYKNEFIKFIRKELDFIYYSPICFISALKNTGLEEVWKNIDLVTEEYYKRIVTAVVNEVVREVYLLKPPPSFKGKNLKIYYSVQKSAAPPHFVLKVNSPKLVHFSYKRYIENQLREAFGFIGAPIRISFSARGKK